jgi:DNA-binding response OmpR family regulator
MGKIMNVLIVEDDASMRELMKTSFAEAGFTVSEATTRDLPHIGASAIDAVVVSIDAPRATRTAVVALLRERFPAAALLAISGYFPARTAASGELATALGVDRTLPKPFRIGQLIDTLTELIHTMRTRASPRPHRHDPNQAGGVASSLPVAADASRCTCTEKI